MSSADPGKNLWFQRMAEGDVSSKQANITRDKDPYEVYWTGMILV